MSPGLISKAILTRIQADTGSGGLFSASGGTAYSTITDAGWNTIRGDKLRPYVTWEISGTADNALTADDIVYEVTFTCIDEASRGCDRLDTVWNRLFGNAMLISGRVPSYGFHRHVLTLAADSTNPLSATGCMCAFTRGDIRVQDETTIVLTMTFEARASAAAVTP